MIACSAGAHGGGDKACLPAIARRARLICAAICDRTSRVDDSALPILLKSLFYFGARQSSRAGCALARSSLPGACCIHSKHDQDSCPFRCGRYPDSSASGASCSAQDSTQRQEDGRSFRTCDLPLQKAEQSMYEFLGELRQVRLRRLVTSVLVLRSERTALRRARRPGSLSEKQSATLLLPLVAKIWMSRTSTAFCDRASRFQTW